MSNATDMASHLIANQLNLVAQMQQQLSDAVSRNDWQTADRMTTIIDKAFSTFLQGIQVMAIDVSGLKNVLLNAASLSPEAVKQIQDTLTKQGQDLEEIKSAIADLNAAASTPQPPTPIPVPVPIPAPV